MVKSLSPHCRAMGSIPGRGLRSHALHHVAKTNKEIKPSSVSESIIWNKGLTAAKEQEVQGENGVGSGTEADLSK